jgi:hypothetical protein
LNFNTVVWQGWLHRLDWANKHMLWPLLALLFLLGPMASAPAMAQYRDTTWEQLVPKGWDPFADMKDLDFSKLTDSDPKAMEALSRMKSAWADAPTEPSINGEKIRIPGFLVPLEEQGGKISEFLLVPYFGACIHTPPPPANQLIHVSMAKPTKAFKTMDTVWVNGTISLGRSDTAMGKAGYRLKADEVVAYKRQK